MAERCGVWNTHPTAKHTMTVSANGSAVIVAFASDVGRDAFSGKTNWSGLMAKGRRKEVTMSDELIEDEAVDEVFEETVEETRLVDANKLVSNLRKCVTSIEDEIKRNRPNTNRYFELVGEKRAYNYAITIVSLGLYE